MLLSGMPAGMPTGFFVPMHYIANWARASGAIPARRERDGRGKRDGTALMAVPSKNAVREVRYSLMTPNVWAT